MAGGEFVGDFVIPKDVKIAFESAIEVGDMHYKIWCDKLKRSGKKTLLDLLLNPNFKALNLPHFSKIDYPKGVATRVTNGIILNAISESHKGFIGGSADLAPSEQYCAKK